MHSGYIDDDRRCNDYHRVLYRATEFMLINTVTIVEFPRPLPVGIHLLSTVVIDDESRTQQQPLDSRWQSIVDNCGAGIIIVSFGTIARSVEMPQSLKVTCAHGVSTFINQFIADEHVECICTIQQLHHRLAVR
jgi:hypothetical protein